MSTELDWLAPAGEAWNADLAAARTLPWVEAKEAFARLAETRLDFTKTVKLDRAFERVWIAAGKPAGGSSIRLAVLGSSTLSHLIPGIRIGALRRGLTVEVYEAGYGLYLQELSDTTSGLCLFAPDVILLCLDARHVTRSGNGVYATVDRIRQCWDLAKSLGCAVIQQTVLPVIMPVLGNNEQQLPESPSSLVERLNGELRAAADTAGVQLLSIDQFTRWSGGLDFWHEPGLWNRAKQEVSPRASHLYGEQVGRLLAAMRGLSRKCLVLDLDNTLWSGVIGDDGLDGIVLGQGSALGEAFIELQRYALSLRARGVILAVCSKNDEINAFLPFDEHQEMVLKRTDIACFVANWADKAQNLRDIARMLNIGLDALVFLDDNPVEQGLVRRELPMVAVPMLPEDPADYVSRLAQAGYFEALTITSEDEDRTALYAANVQREQMRGSVTDLAGYLEALEMKLIWQPFDRSGLSRIVQLANKTNQFNLTTRRYLEGEIDAAMDDPATLTLELRLTDVYGDSGVIGVVIGRLRDEILAIETWLMSCRVLGRRVEEATLSLIVAEARRLNAKHIVGEYRPTAKNGMVRDHFARLGFAPLGEPASDGTSRWTLNVLDYEVKPNPIDIIERRYAASRNLQHA